MTFSLLALASAMLYGAADFIGGLTSRRADTLVIVLVSQAAGLMMVLLLLPLVPTAAPARADWIWGGVAGLAGGVGVALLYRALAVGIMAAVAPVTAVCAVAVPVGVAVLLGERPSLRAACGVLLALVAIVLVSQGGAPAGDEPHTAPNRRSQRAMVLALAAGVAIGCFFLALARTNADAGLWPLVAARAVSVSFFGLLIVAAGRSVWTSRSLLLVITAGGALDMLANLLYLLATRRGPFTLVVTLSSLYPASTVMLARLVLGERIRPRQTVGVVCALLAIVLIVAE